MKAGGRHELDRTPPSVGTCAYAVNKDYSFGATACFEHSSKGTADAGGIGNQVIPLGSTAIAFISIIAPGIVKPMTCTIVETGGSTGK